jgi:hypothetical protein
MGRRYARLAIALVMGSCGGGQRGGGRTAGYCASYDYTDAMFGEPAHVGFCSPTRAECEEIAQRYATYHQMQMACAPAPTIFCWQFSDPSYSSDLSCFATMDECTESAASASSGPSDPELAALLGPTPPPGPCTQR